ncbi:uncharacterized protein LOC111059640 isoform X1 [Nilaparvata lugens]|uniref:uncharacterized protein LOC111059640 isoform X1 n=1 Tax=Nilaparvata lugens TaxID=108931 RepID=UPI00193D162E|nr:uncharacterized protein LOC111059640 isoform X1 [Nilaparvata lugens]XP_039293448.1 uncharacterized protein LOC111059640 isoform X1 [Nilaparvata lugens]XP_039293449.1 uncharacterized protein LOC111059640 isoform X1 [Nilaparvata lugens]
MHKKASNQFHFSIVGIDAELGMTFNIFQYPIFPGSIKKVWVMGDSLIWFTESEYESVASLHYYNASLVPNTEKRTIYKCAFSHRITSLRMDRNYIAIADDNGYVKVWCKHTLELKFEQNHAFYSQHISLFDGCLVISKPEIGLHVYHKIYPTASVIQIHNLKSDPNHCSTLKHTFSVDGQVQSLDSNSHFIFLIFEHKLIQVISKQSYSIIYSHKYDSFLTREIQRAHDDYIVVKEVSNDQRYRILNLVTRQWSDIIPSCAKKLWTVFDNIAVISNWSDKTLHVFDWKRNTQLLTLAIPEQISRRYIVMSVTELRIVIVDFYSNQVVVFKFG